MSKWLSISDFACRGHGQDQGGKKLLMVPWRAHCADTFLPGRLSPAKAVVSY